LSPFVQDFAAPICVPCGFVDNGKGSEVREGKGSVATREGNGEGNEVREGKGAESVSRCYAPSQIDAAGGASQAQGNESTEGHVFIRKTEIIQSSLRPSEHVSKSGEDHRVY